MLVAVIAGGLDRYLMAKGEFGGYCGGFEDTKEGEENQTSRRKERRKERQLRLHICSFVNLRGVVSGNQVNE